jgi:glyoxylase-like metal-dependent hydrolase (beta-lactamase superfamily II)
VSPSGRARGVPVNPEKIPPAVGTVAPGVEILGGLGNALTVDLGDSYLQIDTGENVTMAQEMIAQLGPKHKPVQCIAYSHGHLGYNFACPVWLADAQSLGYSQPTIVAQDQAADLMQLFQRTGPLMELLLAIQFADPIVVNNTPLPITLPTATFSESYSVTGSKRTVELFSAPSETPCSIAAWIPDVEVLYSGPAGLCLEPNLGMPLWPTGNAATWAAAFDRLATYDAQHLVRQYGPVIHGKKEIQEFFSVNARALRYIVDAVIENLNAGQNLNQTLHAITYPSDLFDHKYLAESYSTHGDAVRSVWTSITGWWSRNPTELAAVADDDVATAIRSAISDPASVLSVAEALRAANKQALALHVVDLLALTPGDEDVVVAARALKVQLCRDLAAQAQSFDRQSIYLTSASVIETPPTAPTGIH